MTYQIEFTQIAKKQFSKLTLPIKKRILSTLRRIRINPFRHKSIKKLVDSPFYRLRVGDYRLIIKIDQSIYLISIMKIGHRKNIYK